MHGMNLEGVICLNNIFIPHVTLCDITARHWLTLGKSFPILRAEVLSTLSFFWFFIDLVCSINGQGVKVCVFFIIYIKRVCVLFVFNIDDAFVMLASMVESKIQGRGK